MKNAKFISYSQQIYASMIVKLSLHLKWHYPIMSVIFLPQNEVFFVHDFTLMCVDLVSGGRRSFAERPNYRVPKLVPPPLDT